MKDTKSSFILVFIFYMNLKKPLTFTTNKTLLNKKKTLNDKSNLQFIISIKIIFNKNETFSFNL